MFSSLNLRRQEGSAKVIAILIVITFALAGLLVASWLHARRSESELRSAMESTNKTIASAAGQQADRDVRLRTTLDEIGKLKASVKSPSQALAALPTVLPKLPEPIEITQPEGLAQTGKSGSPERTIDAPKQTQGATSMQNSAAANPSPAQLQIPQADLKPLYDAAQDCRACESQVATLNADLSDEKTQLVAVSQQRDAAIKTAKGGTFWTRTRRAAKWFVAGALAGAVAASVAR